MTLQDTILHHAYKLNALKDIESDAKYGYRILGRRYHLERLEQTRSEIEILELTIETLIEAFIRKEGSRMKL